MMMNAEQLEKNIAWLAANGSPAVQYLTHKHLLHTPPDSEAMRSLWRKTAACKDAEEIFSKQEKDGSWYSGGSWAMKPSYLLQGGWDPVTPKYVTAVWVLPLLGEMGFTVHDKRIRKACEYVLSNGYFTHPVFQGSSAIDIGEVDLGPCRFAQYLIALGSVGETDDRRVRIGYEILVRSQRKDGGWALEQHIRERNWTRSCPFSTYHAAMALYSSGDRQYEAPLVKGLEFLAWHLSTKDEEEIHRFFYHGHSTVRELLMFSEFRVGLKEKAIRSILGWLMTMYNPAGGFFEYAGKPVSKYSNQSEGMDARVAKYRLYHLIERDWLTYHMTRIGMNLIQPARM